VRGETEAVMDDKLSPALGDVLLLTLDEEQKSKVQRRELIQRNGVLQGKGPKKGEERRSPQ